MDNSRRVLVFPTVDEMADFMVNQWIELSWCAIQKKGHFAAALSGGETPVPFYRKLVEEGPKLPWNRTHLFLADERFVPIDDPDSNYHLLHETLLKNIPLPEGNFHAVVTDSPDPLSSAGRYEEEIRRFFMPGPEGIPEFDLIMLGMGADGHTASLFPGKRGCLKTVHLACAVDLDNDRHDRITLTLPVINNARMVVFLVSGKAKASALRDVAEGRDRHLPASRVKPGEGRLLFLADAEAAQYLAANHIRR
ncbi:MAG: 6-phosphogluconolactonase [Nitrospirae bacterium]|nr:6-phosphogluconolactonase [Nitrospirota bacterium]